MAKLDTLTLQVRDVAAQTRFYCDVLGMNDLGRGRVGYDPQEAAIRFVQADGPYAPQPSDLYWKIALSVPDIGLACRQLRAAGVPCSTPGQFRDVGFLAKATDPEGFPIELIDHHFEGQRPASAAQPDPSRLGGGAHLSLITLRTADIAAVEPDILARGMTPLSVQPVTPYGFTLYFYADTAERPPNPDLEAVENRTWVYQRPYTVLEIQHVPSLGSETRPVVGESGYGGVTLRDARDLKPLPRLGMTAAR